MTDHTSEGQPVEYPAAPDKPLRIESMYAFVTIDPIDNTEGVISFPSKDGPMPMVGADMEMVEKLRPMAQEIARGYGITVKLLHFTNREEVEV